MTRIYLDNHHIHLWRFNLEQPAPDWQQKGLHLLSAAENERAQKFKRGMNDYINTRIFMRKILSRYTNKLPENLVFDSNSYGKPFLHDSDLQFNLSHSHQWAVLAVGKNCNLGVDVESTSDRRSIMSIAQHYFHADEIAALGKITNEEEQKDYFFRLWTLKEAFLKALGTGISTGLDKVDFRIDPTNKIAASFSSDLQLQTPEEWQFFQYELNEASVKNWCAVAVRSEEPIQITWIVDAISQIP